MSRISCKTSGRILVITVLVLFPHNFFFNILNKTILKKHRIRLHIENQLTLACLKNKYSKSFQFQSTEIRASLKS